MRTLPLFLLVGSLAASTCGRAQTVIFQETFEDDLGNPALLPGWTWTGDAPVFVPGDGSNWGVRKESKDQSSVFTMYSFMFHPLPYDPNAQFVISASTGWTGSDPLSITHLGLMFVDASLTIDQGQGGATQEPVWSPYETPPFNIPMSPAPYQFGILLGLDDITGPAFAYFDNVVVSAYGLTTDLAEGARPAVPAPWPNPTNDVLHFAANDGALVQLTDASGKLVRTASFTGTQKRTMDLRDLPAGVYLLRTLHGLSVTTQRIVKY